MKIQKKVNQVDFLCCKKLTVPFSALNSKYKYFSRKRLTYPGGTLLRITSLSVFNCERVVQQGLMKYVCLSV